MSQSITSDELHFFDLHWMLRNLDFFRDNISLHQYCRNVLNGGGDMTESEYLRLEKYRFSKRGIAKMGRQRFGYRGRQMLEQVDIYVFNYEERLKDRAKMLRGTWKPRFSRETPVVDDTAEKLKADKEMFRKFKKQYQIIKAYYPELPDLASAILFDNVLKENETNFPEEDWKGMEKKYKNFDFDISQPIETLRDAGLITDSIMNAFIARNASTAGQIFYGSSLQYHLLAEQYGSGNFIVINEMMDRIDSQFNNLNESLNPSDVAHLNMARAILADLYWTL